jgi:molecular chaperone GrpE
MTEQPETKHVSADTGRGESCVPLETPASSTAQGGSSANSPVRDGTHITGPNDSQLLQKIDASLEDQLTLAKLSFGILGKISDQMKQQLEESLVRVQRPILLELVLLHDNLQRALEWARDTSELNKEDVFRRLEILQTELLEILFRKDVQPFEEHPASLDLKMHRTMKTVPTTELSENNKVAQILRTGFNWGEKVLRPEEVVIKKYAMQEPLKGV